MSLWDAQLQDAWTSVGDSVAVTIAPSGALPATLVAPGADQPVGATGQLFSALSGGPQELRKGADRSEPGGLDWRRVDPPRRRSGAGDGAVRHQQIADFQAVQGDRRARPRLPRPATRRRVAVSLAR